MNSVYKSSVFRYEILPPTNRVQGVCLRCESRNIEIATPPQRFRTHDYGCKNTFFRRPWSLGNFKALCLHLLVVSKRSQRRRCIILKPSRTIQGIHFTSLAVSHRLFTTTCSTRQIKSTRKDTVAFDRGQISLLIRMRQC